MATDVGIHTVKARVTDSRGNVRDFIETVDVVSAAPPVVSFRSTDSNSQLREPLDTIIYASVKPSHYKDGIASYQWYLDDVLIPSTSYKGEFNDLYEGAHELKMVATTNHGHVVEEVRTIDVKNNLLPVCSPTFRVESYYTKISSGCRDEDGRMTYYTWEINGEMTGAHGSNVNYYYPSGINPGTLNVKLLAYDDSNESTLVELSIDTE